MTPQEALDKLILLDFEETEMEALEFVNALALGDGSFEFMREFVAEIHAHEFQLSCWVHSDWPRVTDGRTCL